MTPTTARTATIRTRAIPYREPSSRRAVRMPSSLRRVARRLGPAYRRCRNRHVAGVRPVHRVGGRVVGHIRLGPAFGLVPAPGRLAGGYRLAPATGLPPVRWRLGRPAVRRAGGP